MFTFSRSSKTNLVVTALLALVTILLLAPAAQARSMKLSPTKQTITIGHVARGAVVGSRCSVRLPSRKVVRGHKHTSKVRWAWRARHSGRFVVKARCGRKALRAVITVKRARPVNPDAQFGGGDYTDWKNTDDTSGDSNTTPNYPPAPSGKPNATMTQGQLTAFYPSVCLKNLKSDDCKNLADLLTKAEVKEVMTTCAWFKNCEGGKYPYGNPYNLANNGGICSDWAYYKRPDIKLAVESGWYRDWLLAGTPLPEIGWQNGKQGTYPMPDWGRTAWDRRDGWTTWAKKYGFRVDQTPRVGAILVENNHVAYVEKLAPATEREKQAGATHGFFLVSEMNANGHRGKVSQRWLTAEPRGIQMQNQWFVG